MIFGAQYLIYLTFILLFVISLKGSVNERKSFILFLVSLPIIILIIKTIHLFIFEQRPFVEQNIIPLIEQKADASFPSRHTSIMSAIAFAYLFYKSKWAPIFLLLLILVGVSRIYVGVHYPFDILGGIVVGIVAILIGLAIKNFFKRFFGFNRTDNL